MVDSSITNRPNRPYIKFSWYIIQNSKNGAVKSFNFLLWAYVIRQNFISH